MPQEKNKLSLFDMLALVFTGFFSIELVASHASIGPSVIVWLLVLGGIYLLTHGLICAELGSTYPDQGGAYVWIDRAYGPKWAARVSWWGWTNLVSFVPSVLVAMVLVLQEVLGIEISPAGVTIISIIGIWVVVGTNCISLSAGKILSNIGSITKVLFCVAFIGGAFYSFFVNGPVNEFSMATVFPPLDAGAFALAGTLIYGLTGFDMASSNAGQMEDPAHDVPRVLLFAGVGSVILYMLSALAVLFVLPITEIDPSLGMIDAVIGMYGVSKIAVYGIGAFLALTYLSYTFSWAISGNAVALEAGLAGEFPAFFAKTSKSHAPVGAALLMGIGATLLTLIYGFTASDGGALFWSLLAFTSLTFFPPYFLIDFALLKLRKEDVDIERPFQIPGKTLPKIVCVVNLICLAIGTIAFFFPPEGEDPVSYTMIMIVGVIVILVLGEIVIASAEKREAAIEAAGGAPEVGE